MGRKLDYEKSAMADRMSRQGRTSVFEGEDPSDFPGRARAYRDAPMARGPHPGFIRGKDGDREYHRCKSCDREVQPEKHEAHAVSCKGPKPSPPPVRPAKKRG